MKSLLTLLSCFTLANVTQGLDSIKAPVEPGNMKTIFNGKDLTGWDGDSRLWSVEQGVIRGETTKDKKANGNTFLIWQGGRTKDFDLRISFKVSTQNNSGIQYRSKHITEKARNKWVVRGYQHEIRNSNKMPNVPGFIYAEGGKRGRMCLAGQKVLWNSEGNKEVLGTVISDKGFAKLFTVDAWNDVVIRAKGNHIQHFMNGRLILDCTDKHPERSLLDGVLALQLHAGAPMWCEFKNIRIGNLN